MNISNNLFKKQKAKKYYNILIYIIFVGYMINLSINTSSLPKKIAYIALLLFFGFFAALYEYLNITYNKAIDALTKDCNPFKGEYLINIVEKYDLFKSFKRPICIFKLLMFRDMGKPREILDLLNNTGKKTFSSSYELLLIYYHSLFLAYAELGDKLKTRECYNKLLELKEKKQKGKEAVLLFSLNEATGYFKYLSSNFTKSRKAYLKVDVNNMNHREKVNYYMLLAKLELAEMNYKESKELLQYVIDNGNKMNIVNEAHELIINL